MLGKKSDGVVGARVAVPASVALGLALGGVIAATQFPAAGNDDSHIT